ncbi:MAG: hypothetical protein JEZ01_03535 [Labilibaculum sp.]|nr:hypothetical protein [Labilibaculum sp.]MBI9056825.1 hypothetical protein [Labilibaculum sp.]
MQENKDQEYNPDTSDIPFKMIQEYHLILANHFKEYKLDSLDKLNKNILSIFYMTYKKKRGKANEEEFAFQMLSIIKEVNPQIYEFLTK